MSAMSGPQLSDNLKKLPTQTDSFLTAARLLRGGWTEDRKKAGWQVSSLDCSTNQPRLSKPDGNLVSKHAEISPKEPVSWAPAMSRSKKSEDGETHSEKQADEVKQIAERVFLARRQRERQMSQAGVVCVWASGCRSTCRVSRRFKAPILPVIAEM